MDLHRIAREIAAGVQPLPLIQACNLRHVNQKKLAAAPALHWEVAGTAQERNLQDTAAVLFYKVPGLQRVDCANSKQP
jgi:hypothetical protein